MLIVIHGLGEHSGRYGELVEALSELPIAIYRYDLRGHGRSEGVPVYVDCFDHFIEDLYTFRTFIEARRSSQNLRFILLGQSLGGLIAILGALQNQTKWRALISLSPFFEVAAAHKLLLWLTLFLDLLVPKKIWNNPIAPIFLTHDSEQLERYERDPLIQRRITIRLAREMFRACASAQARANEITLPVLFLASGDDRIVSLGKAKEFFAKIASPDKKIQVFDGFYHELLHETGRQKPIAAVKDYLLHLGL